MKAVGIAVGHLCLLVTVSAYTANHEAKALQEGGGIPPCLATCNIDPADPIPFLTSMSDCANLRSSLTGECAWCGSSCSREVKEEVARRWAELQTGDNPLACMADLMEDDGSGDDEDDTCQCFANGAANEPFCESGQITDPHACEADARCHWGPGEVAQCRDMVSSGPPPCQCFANGAANEPFCESGQITDPHACEADARCHWGPGEVAQCRDMVSSGPPPCLAPCGDTLGFADCADLRAKLTSDSWCGSSCDASVKEEIARRWGDAQMSHGGSEYGVTAPDDDPLACLSDDEDEVVPSPSPDNTTDAPDGADLSRAALKAAMRQARQEAKDDIRRARQDARRRRREERREERRGPQ